MDPAEQRRRKAAGEDLSDWSRYAYGFTDQKPGRAAYVIRAAFLVVAIVQVASCIRWR